MTPKQKIALSMIDADRLRIQTSRIMFRTDGGRLLPCGSVSRQTLAGLRRLDWVALVDGRLVLTPLGQDELRHGRVVTANDRGKARYRGAADMREALR